MLPYISNIPRESSISVDRFGGINVKDDISFGECISCCDVSPSSYPLISSRKKRSLCSRCDGIINGVGSCDGFFYTYYKDEPKGIFLCFKGKNYEFTNLSESKDYTSKRQFAVLKTAIVIIPDNVIFHIDTLKFSRINVNQSYKKSDIATKFNAEGLTSSMLDYKNDDKRGLFTSSSIYSHVKSYIYDGYKREFYTLSFADDLSVGDVVKLKLNITVDALEVSDEYYAYLNKLRTEGIMVKIKGKTVKTHYTPVGYITETTGLSFEGSVLNTQGYANIYFTDFSIERTMPKATSIAAFNNRIWAVGEGGIYASKLGTPTVWNDFAVDSFGTLPASSFSTVAGSEGNFTAIIPHGNYIYAFKENHIHKIYGDTPDEYKISGIEAPGCTKNPYTVSVCGSYLMYASKSGICVLKEGYPKIISERIGNVDALCGASCGNIYYFISQKNLERVIYVYDMEHNVWTMQSCGKNANHLCSDGNDVCYAEAGELIYLTSDKGEEYEKNVCWRFRLRFERGGFGDDTALSTNIKISLGKDASCTAFAIYDDDTRGAVAGCLYDETACGNCVIRLPVKRDAGFSIEFKGVGEFTMKSIKFNYYKSYNE